MLCKYKDVLGRPNEGVHSWRVFDIAIVDVALTLVAAALIAAYFHLPVWQPALALFVLGIVAHRVFCVRTTVDKWLFNVFNDKNSKTQKRVRFNV